MTITNGYCTLAQFKTLYNVQGTDASRDAEIEYIIGAVARLIDAYCHRRFFTSTNDETRYYTANREDEFDCPDDIISITNLYSDLDGSRAYGTTWAITDYDLLPYNAALDSKPYTKITLTPNSIVSFVTWRKGIKIVGKFGYAAIAPQLVMEANLLQSFRMWMRKAAPFGVAGGGDMGQSIVIPKLDPDIEIMLNALRRL